MRMRHSRGFTLIELMITIVIIAILASIAIPMYDGATRKTRRAEAKSALMQVMTIQEQYYTQHNTYKAFTPGPTESTFKWYSAATPESSYYEISGQACDGSTIDECIALHAQPGGEHVNRSFRDPECGTLVLTSRGEKTIISNRQTMGCWE